MFTFNGLRVHLPIKVLGIKMPKKKRKSSLGRLTADAKKMQKTRLNEDEKTYSQRMEINKERHVIGRISEISEHRDQRLAVRRYKENLKSKTILKEHQKAVKNASPIVSQVVSQVVSRTRGALKRKALNELFHPSKKLKEVITLYFLHYYYRIGRI